MKRIIIYTFALFSMMQFTTINAQENTKKKHFNVETYKSQKNAYITAELKLTPEEAAAFIPLANQMEHEKFEANMKCKKATHNIKKLQSPTDADYNNVIDICLKVRYREAELENKYYPKFRSILSPAKLFKYKNAESEFNRLFMKKRNEKK